MEVNLAAVPEQIHLWLETQDFGQVLRLRPVSGGCISSGRILTTSKGHSFFLKTNSRVPEDFFQREAEGLRALGAAGGARAPETFLFGRDFILMEDLDPGTPAPNFWERLGQELATVHGTTRGVFGFDSGNYLGSTPQPNRWEPDGFRFFGEQRLVYQARLAADRGLIGERQFSQVERLSRRLPEMIPPQPASLIHGDLWRGNVISDNIGRPALIDPAVHYGWAEADLAMTALFGPFPNRFYSSYQEARLLPSGIEERYPIYNLYHLLNHLNLFGRGYYHQVIRILDRYA